MAAADSQAWLHTLNDAIATTGAAYKMMLARDHMNAEIHRAEVRLSPLTVDLGVVHDALQVLSTDIEHSGLI